MAQDNQTPAAAAVPADADQPSRIAAILSWAKDNKLEALLLLGVSGVLIFFFLIRESYGVDRDQSTIEWMWKACGDPRFDYFHGRLIPLAVIGLLIYHWPKIVAAEKGSELWGLAIAVGGILFYLIAERVLQARVAAGAMPLIIFGLVVYIWGKEVGRYVFFPCCLIYFAIPLPGLMQATNGLQVFSTKVAAVVGKACQIDLVSAGSQIASANNAWQFEVNEGCSGIRSLVALTLIAAIYGHLTQDRTWKKIVLIASALPLAIIANAVRISTIVLIAEYVDETFAGKTYHNWSGFVFFLVIGLAGILLISKLINGGFKKGNRVKVRTTVVRRDVPNQEAN